LPDGVRVAGVVVAGALEVLKNDWKAGCCGTLLGFRGGRLLSLGAFFLKREVEDSMLKMSSMMEF
jgi:hypothetical protein